MEWYVGTGADELVVPKEREESDMLLSSESWMQWGMNAPESFWLPDKYFVTEAKPVGELNFMGKSLSKEVESEMFTHERDQSSGSSVCGGSSETLVHRNTLPRDWPDHQLDDLEGIDEMDDIFLSSLLEDLPITEDSRGSFCFPPRPLCTKTPSDDLSTDTMFDTQSVARNSHGLNSSKYLKTHAFSPTVDWDSKEVTSSYLLNSRQKDCSSIKSPVENIMVPSEQSKADGHMGDETSLEESVLQELGTVMELMTEKTRLCFRDALYRLAENSKQYTLNQKQQGDLGLDELHESVVHDETSRSGTTEASELETNTIDRAIANLMFSKMELNAQELPAVSEDLEQETIPTKGPCDYSSNQPKMPHYLQCRSLPDNGFSVADLKIETVGHRSRKS